MLAGVRGCCADFVVAVCFLFSVSFAWYSWKFSIQIAVRLYWQTVCVVLQAIRTSAGLGCSATTSVLSELAWLGLLCITSGREFTFEQGSASNRYGFWILFCSCNYQILLQSLQAFRNSNDSRRLSCNLYSSAWASQRRIPFSFR